MVLLSALQQKNRKNKEKQINNNPAREELLEINWEDHNLRDFLVVLTPVFLLLAILTLIFYFISPLGFYVTLFIAALMLLLVLTILLSRLTSIDTYYLTNTNLIVETYSFVRINTREYSLENFDCIVSQFTMVGNKVNFQDIRIWRYDQSDFSPDPESEEIIYTAPHKYGETADQLRHELKKGGIKLVNFYHHESRFGVPQDLYTEFLKRSENCETCPEIPEWEKKETKLSCPECYTIVEFE